MLEANADMRVVASVDDGREAVAKALALRPDVAVIDISRCRGFNGLDATRAILREAPDNRAWSCSRCVSSSDLDPASATPPERAGYLLKESAGDEVVKAVRAVAAGQRFIGEGIVDRMLAGYAPNASVAELLTPRERDVLRLIVEGKSNAEAAAALGLSPRSVETYRLRLMQKLDLQDLPSLVKFAIRHGMTTLD